MISENTNLDGAVVSRAMDAILDLWAISRKHPELSKQIVMKLRDLGLFDDWQTQALIAALNLRSA